MPETTVEALGLLKMDFLGLRNLDVIEGGRLIGGGSTSRPCHSTTRRRTRCSRAARRWASSSSSRGMREALRQVRPTEFDDLIALVALYRPGPMQYIPKYARKAGQARVTFNDPRLKAITGSTYGVSMYQEQAMEIAKRSPASRPAEADDLRKAIGKKDKLMASLKDDFIDGCIAQRASEQVARSCGTTREVQTTPSTRPTRPATR